VLEVFDGHGVHERERAVDLLVRHVHRGRQEFVRCIAR
jgi:hypothetical protein